VLGFPIRKSSDQRLVDSSPRHIAASHVLHRLSMPRHPPCALKHLLTQKPKKKITQNEHAPLPATRSFRCSQPLFNAQTPHPTTKMEGQHSDKPDCCLRPNSVSGDSSAVVHPALVHYRREPLTAITPPIGVFLVVLLRKEVIQPHLPVRLPCYDFVPIADPTFDSSLPKG
jgi:hypothetical protein